MDVNELRRRRAGLVREMRELLDASEAQKRGLTEKESLRWDELEREVDRLADQISREGLVGGFERDLTQRARPDFDPRLAMGGLTSVAPVDKDTAVLTGEQRMADWAQARGRGHDELDFDPDEFSLGRAVRAMATGDWHKARVERRALGEGVGAEGGFLIPEPLAVRVIDRLRNATQVIRAGAVTVPMTADLLNIARMTGGSTAGWKNEGAAVSESDQTYDRVTFTARTAVVLQKLSVELAEDLSDEANRIIENEIAQALAAKLDLAVLRGSGSAPEPRGIRNQTGVTIIAHGGANGGTPTNHDFIVDAISAVRDANGTPNAAIASSRSVKTLDKLKDTTNQPLQPPAAVAALRHLVSNQIPNTLTVGTSTDCSELYVADWSTVMIGVRPSLQIRLQRLKERYMDTMQLGIIAWLRADVQLSQPSLSAVVTGLRP